MATLIDTLLVSLKLDSGGFANDAKKATTENDKLADSIDALNETLGGVNETLKGTREQQKKAKEQSDSFTKSINNATKALAGLFTTIFMSTGLTKLIEDTARSNDQLNFLSKNLGMNATQVKRWQGAAELSGGSAEGMASSMANLSKSLWDLVTVGDTSILPYFNALNVGVVKSNGELRNLDDILLDVADSLSQMSRPQAYNFAKNMGFDEGTINMLLQGRQEMERQLALQKDIVVSSEQELEISRQLQQQNALVGMQWDGLKTLLGNYLIPYALKLSATVTGFLGYLNKNRDTAIFIFKALGTVIGVTLIPIVLKAATAFVGLFGAIGLLPALLLLLGASLWMLYDDFKKWKEGGESLLGEYWEKWDSTITPILEKLDEFKDWFKESTVGKWFTDQEGNLETWKVALGGFALWFGGKWVVKILGGFASLSLGAAKWALSLTKAFALVTASAAKFLAKNPWLLMLYSEQTASTEQEDNATRNSNRDNFYRNHAMANLNKKGKPYAEIDVTNEILRMTIAGEMPEPTEDDLNENTTVGRKKDLLKSGAIGVKDNTSDIDDGEVSSKNGERGLRYNSPLNLAYAKQSGAQNDGKGWAKFDRPYDGIRASSRQLMMYYNGTSAAAGYKKLQTVWDIIHQWAPKGHGSNDPAGYSKTVAGRMGVGVNSVLDLNNPEVMHSLIKEMSKVENNNKYPYSDALSMAAIKGTGDPTQNVLSNIQSFNKQISTPFAAGVTGLAKGFLDQSNALKSQSQTVNNNRTDVSVGGITIHTTATTLSGVNEEAAEEATRRVYQLVPTMS